MNMLQVKHNQRYVVVSYVEGAKCAYDAREFQSLRHESTNYPVPAIWERVYLFPDYVLIYRLSIPMVSGYLSKRFHKAR